MTKRTHGHHAHYKTGLVSIDQVQHGKIQLQDGHTEYAMLVSDSDFRAWINWLIAQSLPHAKSRDAHADLTALRSDCRKTRLDDDSARWFFLNELSGMAAFRRTRIKLIVESQERAS